MTVQYDNSYVALQQASASNINVEVENGNLEDSAGNSIYFGVQPDSDVAYRGLPHLYVTQVKGASPTGNLEVLNGDIHVAGYGDVTLTDPAGRRNVSSVGNDGGNDGNIQTDFGGNIEVEYTETTTTTDTTRNASSVSSQSSLPVQQSANPPSDATDVFMSGAVKVKSSTPSDVGVQVNVEFDRDGDGLVEREESISDFGGDNDNTNIRDTNLDTSSKTVLVQYDQGRGDYDSSDFEQATAAIVWETESTTTSTETTDISLF